MDRPIVRSYCLDGDECQVLFHFDKSCDRYFGEYPDFEESPRYTVNGWPWVTAMQEACEHGINGYCEAHRCLECGSCQYYRQEQEHDLVGICTHELRRRA